MIAMDLIIWVLLILLLVILISQFLIEWKINKVKKIKEGKFSIKKEVSFVSKEPLGKKIWGVWLSLKQIIKDINQNNKDKKKIKLKNLAQLALDDARENEGILKKAIDEQNMDFMIKARMDFIEAKRKVKKLLNELEKLG